MSLSPRSWGGYRRGLVAPKITLVHPGLVALQMTPMGPGLRALLDSTWSGGRSLVRPRIPLGP